MRANTRFSAIHHPDLGYFDEGLDLTDPALYVSAVATDDRATLLPPVAYRSKVFQDLEDEKIWTRSWVCIGTVDEIPNPGDLLPFTVGNHGIHVQRAEDGALVGRFNKAQHGGCRFVPQQCQTGRKTRCSFTSCGHSRDRAAIGADELGDSTPAMGQYLGVDPTRLLPVHVTTWGPFVFVNLDVDPPPLAERLGTCASLLTGRALAMGRTRWIEGAANWKLAGPALIDPFAGDVAPDAGGWVLHGRPGGAFADAEKVIWLFPNLMIGIGGDAVTAAILQPTAFDSTLYRVLGSTPAAQQALAAAVEWAAATAQAVHDDCAAWGTPSHPTEAATDAPSLDGPGGRLFQQFLVDRLLTASETYWNAPVYDASLSAGAGNRNERRWSTASNR